MSTVGQIERATQDRVVKQLLHEQLEYEYLGNWGVRQGNSNIEEVYLRRFLKRQGYSDVLIGKALFELQKVAGDQARSLYDINKDVYGLLRYGVKVRPDVGENTETVWLIDWKNPLNNDFAVAEEVTVEGEHTKRPDVVVYVNGIALGCAGVEALGRIGERGHPPESGQPEEDIYPAILHDYTVDHGGQRYRGAALWSDRDSREVLPDLEREERDREPAGSCSDAALRETAFSGDDP